MPHSMLLAFSVTAPTLVRGVASGVVFGLLATGLVLVYRSSGIINFAHAELGLIASAMVELLVTRGNVPFWMSLPAALGTAATVAALCELVVIRRLRNAPKVMTVVATLGLSQFLLFLTAAVRGSATSTMPMPPGFPEWHLQSLTMNPAFTAILLLGPLSVVGVSMLLSRTQIGRTIRGAAANPEAARLAGLSPTRASAISWGIAGALSGLSSILVTGAFGAASASSAGPTLLVPAIAAAVIARFRSIGIAFAAGVGLGIFQEVVSFNVDSGGAVTLAMFVVVLVGLLVQRSSGPRAADTSNWMSIASTPLTPRGRRIGAAVAVIVGGAIVVIGALGSSATAVSLTFVVATASIALSVFVITGMAGQLSLGQFAVAGVGAVVGLQVTAKSGDLLLGLIFAGTAGALTTLLIGLPGLRLRGLFAAVTTLAFAVVAREWLLAQTWMAGFGRSLDDASVLGLNLRTTQARFLFCVCTYLFLVLIVHNVNSSGLGRRIRALRDNESQARGFTVSAIATRASSFAFAGFVAGASGLLLGVGASTITAANFPSSQSITIVAAAVLGGLQGVFGSLLGALYLVGIPRFVPLDNAGLAATSFGWLALLLVAPQGIGGLLNRLLGRLAGAPTPALVQTASPAPAGFSLGGLSGTKRPEPDGSVLLRASGLRKHYGGVRAVDGVDFEVRVGETVGLIGGNGAGKTTLFELLGGFVAPDSGTITFRGVDITKKSAERRALLGVIRSFQDAALFSTFTVRDAVLVALERRHRTRVLPALIGLRRHEKAQRIRADELLAMCGLSSYASSVVSTLSTGTRRFTELACMIALDPELLLLDEPSAGIAQRETEALTNVIRTVKEQLGTTVVVIEHDMPFIRSLSDRLVVMEAGRVLVSGDPSTVLSDERVIASYLGTNAAAIERSGEGDGSRAADGVRATFGSTGGRRRWTVPTREVRMASRIRAVTNFNRRLAWVTLAWLVVATFSSWAEAPLHLPRWVAWSSNNLFTVNFVLHFAMSAFVYRLPRPRTNPRIMQAYLGYAILLFTLVSQSGRKEPLHAITFAILWLLIGGHIVLAVRSRARRAGAGAVSVRSGVSIPAVSARSSVAPIAARTSGSPERVRRPPSVPDGPGPLGLSFSPFAFGAIGLVVTIVGFIVTARGFHLRKGGVSLMPAAFVGIIGVHMVLGWQWLRLRRPSELRFAPIAAAVLVGLIFDNIILALGSPLGPGNFLRALSAPRYWIHAIGTPLLILLVLEIGSRCGLSWTQRRRWTWTLLAFVGIGFGLGNDGFGQKLKYSTSGGVARYANEAVKGPPVSSIAVIIIMITVSVMIWQRGYSPMMAVCSLVMLVGAAVGASFPLLGNLAECFFVIALLAGMQAAAGYRPGQSAMRRSFAGSTPAPAEPIRIRGLPIPWTTALVAVLVSLLGVVHASANVRVPRGAPGTVVALFCLAILSMCASFVLYVAVSPGSQAASLASLGLLLFAVDAVALLPGNISGGASWLRHVHDLRSVLVPLAAALLVPFVGTLAAVVTGNQRWLRTGRLAGVIALVLGIAVCLRAGSSWMYSGYASRFSSDGLATPGLLVVGAVSLVMVRLGLLILARTGAVAPLAFAVLSLVATWGGQFNPLVFALAPLALCGAMTCASMESASIAQRARNQRGLRRQPSRKPRRSGSLSSIGGAE